MKKWLSVFFALALSLGTFSLAHGETITLAAMKAVAPESVTITLNGTSYTAPVILPEGDALPTLLCMRQPFPPVEGVAEDNAYAFHETEKDLIWGNVNKYQRCVLGPSSTPPCNDYTIEEAVQLVLDYSHAQGLPQEADIRLDQATGMSGLCKMKGVTMTVDGVSFRATVPDITQPVSGKEKGLWLFSMAQYFYGAKLFMAQDPNIAWNTPKDETGRQYVVAPPIYTDSLRVMDEENYSFGLSCLYEAGTLCADTPMLSLAEIVDKISSLGQQGQLKSIYRLQLGYLYLTVKDEYSVCGNTYDANKQRYVLFPCWEIAGYALNTFTEKTFADADMPDEEAILWNGFGDNWQSPFYRLFIDARTGEVITADELFTELDE